MANADDPASSHNHNNRNSRSGSHGYGKATNAADTQEHDMRLVVKLLDEAYGSSENNAVRRKTLAEGVARAIGAEKWLWVVSRIGAENENPMSISILHSGLPEDVVARIFEASQDLRALPPENEPLIELIKTGKPFTKRREDMVPDDEWYGSEHLEKHRKPIDFNEFVFAVVPLGEGVFSAVGMHRGFDKPAFSERERRIAHSVVTEVRTLHAGALPTDESSDKIPDLTPKIRVVFGLLMEGWSRKRIAEHLGRSEHTIRDHCRKIYRHFEVKDQRGLLAKFSTASGFSSGDAGVYEPKPARNGQAKNGNIKNSKASKPTTNNND